MKMKCFLFLGVFFLFSCEKEEDIILEYVAPELIFEEQILDEEFVMAIDFGSDGSAWIATNPSGLIKYINGESQKFNRHNSNMPACSMIWDVAVDNNNEVWLGTTSGLVHFDGSKFKLYNSSNSVMPVDYVSNVEIDSENRVWFASARANEGGLMLYDRQTIKPIFPLDKDISNKIIHDIKIDGRDNVYIAIGNYVTNCSVFKIERQMRRNYEVKPIKGSFYYFGEIELGRRNELFLAVDYSLSSTLIHSGPTILKYSNEELENINPFSQYWWRCNIEIDKYGNLWTSFIDGENGYVGFYYDDEWELEEMDFAKDWIVCMKSDANGRMWYGTGTGIFIVR